MAPPRRPAGRRDRGRRWHRRATRPAARSGDAADEQPDN